MKISSEIQNQKLERLAKEQGLTAKEYKRRCDKNTAKNQGMTLYEYNKNRLSIAAKNRGLTDTEYRRLLADKSARNKGFRNKRDYDKADKRARVLHITREQYCSSLDKDENGFYILPELPKKSKT